MSMALDYGTKGETLETRGYDANQTVYIKLWYNLMWTRFPDLRKGSRNYRFGGVMSQVDPASEQHVLIPAITTARLLWLSTDNA
jgi:hypothetical protein